MLSTEVLQNTTDLEAVKILFIKCGHGIENTSFFNWSETSINEELKQSHFFVGRNTLGKIISFIAFRETDEFLEIMAMATDPEFKNHGFMSFTLLKFVEKYSNSRKSIFLEVHSQNKTALTVYRKCKFNVVRVRKNYYRDLGDALVMEYSPL